MPAVTVDDLLVLPRVPRPDATTATERPVVSVTAAPSGFEGEGFPVRRAFAGVERGRARPLRATSTRWARSTTRRASPRARRGTRTAASRPSPTSSTAIFRHQDSNGGGGLITDGDTQWMTAGSGMLHIEAPPEELVASGGLLPRHPALGEPARSREVDRRRATRTSAAARCALPQLRRRARSCASSPARSPATRARASPTPPSPCVHVTAVTRRASSTCPGAPTSTRWSTCWPARAPSAPEVPVRTGNLTVFGAGRRHHPRRRRRAGQPRPQPRGAAARRAARSASPSPPTARS